MHDRVRLFLVDERFLLDMIRWLKAPADYDAIGFDCPDIPDGSQIVGVNYDFCRRAFCVMVEHESFDVIPAGWEAPMCPRLQTVTLRRDRPPTDEYAGMHAFFFRDPN